MELKQPRLEEWEIIMHPWKHLRGKVYNSSRFADGEVMRTSELFNLDESNRIAQTKNSKYILGEKFAPIKQDEAEPRKEG